MHLTLWCCAISQVPQTLIVSIHKKTPCNLCVFYKVRWVDVWWAAINSSMSNLVSRPNQVTQLSTGFDDNPSLLRAKLSISCSNTWVIKFTFEYLMVIQYFNVFAYFLFGTLQIIFQWLICASHPTILPTSLKSAAIASRCPRCPHEWNSCRGIVARAVDREVSTSARVNYNALSTARMPIIWRWHLHLWIINLYSILAIHVNHLSLLWRRRRWKKKKKQLSSERVHGTKCDHARANLRVFIVHGNECTRRSARRSARRCAQWQRKSKSEVISPAVISRGDPIYNNFYGIPAGQRPALLEWLWLWWWVGGMHARLLLRGWL